MNGLTGPGKSFRFQSAALFGTTEVVPFHETIYKVDMPIAEISGAKRNDPRKGR